MKKLSRIKLPITEEQVVIIYLCSLTAACLIYFACYLYALYRILHPAPLDGVDGVVGIAYIRVRTKAEFILKRQVFVRT